VPRALPLSKKVLTLAGDGKRLFMSTTGRNETRWKPSPPCWRSRIEQPLR